MPAPQTKTTSKSRLKRGKTSSYPNPRVGKMGGTVDGRNPAPPGMYETLSYQLVSRISSINRIWGFGWEHTLDWWVSNTILVYLSIYRYFVKTPTFGFGGQVSLCIAKKNHCTCSNKQTSSVWLSTQVVKTVSCRPIYIPHRIHLWFITYMKNQKKHQM